MITILRTRQLLGRQTFTNIINLVEFHGLFYIAFPIKTTATLSIAVTQFAKGKLRHSYGKS